MKLIDLFSSRARKRKELLEQRSQTRADYEAENVKLKAEITAILQDPALVAHRRALDLERQIKELENQLQQAKLTAAQKLNALNDAISAAADPRVTEFIRWASDEKTRVANDIVNRGLLVYNALGVPQGRLVTNADKIGAYVQALNHAIAEAKTLETSNDDAGDAIANIRASLPVPDFSAEEIQTTAAVAFALQ
jgi:hypothetical protein